MKKDIRVETDSLGKVEVPAQAYWGAQTQRAVENFPISGIRMPRRLIRALGMIKRAAAEFNRERGQLDAKIADAIVEAAGEVAGGKLDEQFPLDIFQTGSGTSTNMNANEVIANRAAEILGLERGAKKIHPNDHVNKGQSSNDVIPTAIHIAALEGLERDLLPALRKLAGALERKAAQFDDIVKVGRTHLMDAVPVRLGQEFGGYASQVAQGVKRIEDCRTRLSELALGGTAVGTGLNAPPGLAESVIASVSKQTGLQFCQAGNLFEALAAKDAVVEASGALKTVACSLSKVANDIRWLGSGPRCGIGELLLPELQPGSSIMPGKINPVMPEMMRMVAAQVIGNDAAVTVGGLSGDFELNVMMPVMAHNILQSIDILANGAEAFRTRCVEGLEANRERCEEIIERSLMMVTSLAPKIGYDVASKLAQEAHRSGRTIRELALDKKLLPEAELNKLLDPRGMTGPKRGRKAAAS
ncbi:MAG: class II fumarate hydratase [Acidobacteriota bacterium]